MAVINIGGVAFPPFTDLFGPARLPYRIVAISDSDAQPLPSELEDEVPELSPRAAALKERAGENVLVALSQRTLEWDLAQAGNTKVMLDALTQVKPKVGPQLATEMAGLSAAVQAQAILDKVSDVKGRFAQ